MLLLLCALLIIHRWYMRRSERRHEKRYSDDGFSYDSPMPPPPPPPPAAAVLGRTKSTRSDATIIDEMITAAYAAQEARCGIARRYSLFPPSKDRPDSAVEGGKEEK